MTLDEVLALGFSHMQIGIYLPPPSKKKVVTYEQVKKQLKNGTVKESKRRVVTIIEPYHDDAVVHAVANYLKKYTSIKLG